MSKHGYTFRARAALDGLDVGVSTTVDDRGESPEKLASFRTILHREAKNRGIEIRIFRQPGGLTILRMA